MRAWLLVLSLSCAACAAPRHYQRAFASPAGAPPAPDCDALDAAKFRWLIVSAASGAVAGAGGLATLPVTSTTGKDVLAGAALSVGVLSAVSAVALNYYDSEFKSQHCIQTAP